MCSTLTTGIFDPTLMPVRSCLRMDDEVGSNYGPMLRKSVTFNDTAQLHDDVTLLVALHSSFTAQGSKVQFFPKRPPIKSPYTRQKELRVTFSFLLRNRTRGSKLHIPGLSRGGE